MKGSIFGELIFSEWKWGSVLWITGSSRCGDVETLFNLKLSARETLPWYFSLVFFGLSSQARREGNPDHKSWGRASHVAQTAQGTHLSSGAIKTQIAQEEWNCPVQHELQTVMVGPWDVWGLTLEGGKKGLMCWGFYFLFLWFFFCGLVCEKNRDVIAMWTECRQT